MLDRGFFLTLQAIRRQLAAMPNELYLVRLIHHATHRAFPGERLWSAAQLTSAATLRFLRLRNRQGCDIYIHPYSGDRNAGYILLDLDTASPTVLETMRLQGLEPCVVLQTSPGHHTCAPHLQAWLHLSRSPLEPALATSVAQCLARTYGGDLASADWRHLGRLAGFTNQKPARRTHRGFAPWVTVLHARAGLASRAQHLLQSAMASGTRPRFAAPLDDNCEPEAPLASTSITARQAVQAYRYWTRRWNIADRFAQPDWSVVDLWVARALLSQGTPAAHVRKILQLGSPEFPRRHGNPQDYLRRTLARAAFSCSPPAPPVWVAPTPVETSAPSQRAAASTHTEAET